MKSLLLFLLVWFLVITYESILLFGLVVGGHWLISLITIGGLFGVFLTVFSSVSLLCVFCGLMVLPIFLFW